MQTEFTAIKGTVREDADVMSVSQQNTVFCSESITFVARNIELYHFRVN